LIGSLRSDRDRAIAGLMPFSGLRSAEVLSVAVRDVDGNTGDAAGHLVVADLDLAHARTDPRLERTGPGERRRCLLRAHEVGDVDGVELDVVEALDECVGLFATPITEVGARRGGVEQTVDVRGRLGMANQQETHDGQAR